VIAFADDVQYPDDSCYSQGLALATSANKEKLTDFAVRIHPSLQSQANYSKAFTEAFRLLATTDTNNSDSVMSSGRRGMKLSSLKWWFSVVVTSFGRSTKLLYARPG